jgi:hypothetical protein
MRTFTVIKKEAIGDTKILITLDEQEAIDEFGRLLISEADRIEKTLGMNREQAVLIANELYRLDVVTE